MKFIPLLSTTMLAGFAGKALYRSAQVAVSLSAPAHDTLAQQQDEPSVFRPMVDVCRLRYGLEMEFLFPSESFEPVDGVSDPMRYIQRALEQANITSSVFRRKRLSKEPDATKNPSEWKIVREHSGFELVSPVYSSLEPVQRSIHVLKSISVGTHPLNTNMHASIDVSHGSVEQIRNVYKNFVATEEALDEIRHPIQRANANKKSLSIAKQFRDIQLAYHAFDKCEGEDAYRCLRLTGNPYFPSRAHFPLLDLRLDDRQNTPKRLEFRGQTSSDDSEFVVNWIRLLHNLVNASFAGIVLDSNMQWTELNRSWQALFDQLVRDDLLQIYFEFRREYLKSCINVGCRTTVGTDGEPIRIEAPPIQYVGQRDYGN